MTKLLGWGYRMQFDCTLRSFCDFSKLSLFFHRVPERALVRNSHSQTARCKMSRDGHLDSLARSASRIHPRGSWPSPPEAWRKSRACAVRQARRILSSGNPNFSWRHQSPRDHHVIWDWLEMQISWFWSWVHVVWYVKMSSPNFLPRELSAARFFRNPWGRV
jgi:hypothetical protein